MHHASVHMQMCPHQDTKFIKPVFEQQIRVQAHEEQCLHSNIALLMGGLYAWQHDQLLVKFITVKMQSKSQSIAKNIQGVFLDEGAGWGVKSKERLRL